MQQLQVSTQYQEQNLLLSFKIKVAIAKVAPHSVLLWAREYTVSYAAKEADISSRVAINIYQWLHEVCTAKLLETGGRV